MDTVLCVCVCVQLYFRHHPVLTLTFYAEGNGAEKKHNDSICSQKRALTVHGIAPFEENHMIRRHSKVRCVYVSL